MNRNMTFRVWDNVNKKIIKDFALLGDDGFGLTDDEPFSNDLVLMQCTGLKDKDGMEIFEGDLLKQNFENEMGSFSEATGVIEWCPHHAGMEAVIRTNGERTGFSIGEDCRVIGNLFENPELAPLDEPRRSHTDFTGPTGV